jgi:hypothetical protein
VSDSTASVLSSDGSSCEGDGGYNDIGSGAGVTVRDETDTIIAVGALAPGRVEEFSCTFPFFVTGIPNSKFYSVEVSHRGAIAYSHEQLEQQDWMVSLSLGY